MFSRDCFRSTRSVLNKANKSAGNAKHFQLFQRVCNAMASFVPRSEERGLSLVGNI